MESEQKQQPTSTDRADDGTGPYVQDTHPVTTGPTLTVPGSCPAASPQQPTSTGVRFQSAAPGQFDPFGARHPRPVIRPNAFAPPNIRFQWQGTPANTPQQTSTQHVNSREGRVAQAGSIPHSSVCPADVAQRTVEMVVDKSFSGSDACAFRLYFSSPQNGGGVVKNMYHIEDKGVFRVTFANSDVARRVCERTHTIGNREVHVKLHIPTAPEAAVYPDKMLIQKIPDGITKDALIRFLGEVTNLRVEKVLYGEETGVALATFEGDLDMRLVQENCQRTQMAGVKLQVSEVPVSKCIMVKNFRSSAESRLSQFFKNLDDTFERTDTVPLDETQVYLVYFKDPEAIKRIMDRERWCDGKKLQIEVYLECLGPSGGKSEPTVFTVPDPVTFDNIDQYKVNFLNQNPAAKEHLFFDLAKQHARPTFKMKAVTVECTLDRKYPNAHDLTGKWADDVTHTILSHLNRIHTQRIYIRDRAWPQVEKRVSKALNPPPDEASVVEVRDAHLFVVTGRKDEVQSVCGIIRKIETDVEDDLKSKTQILFLKETSLQTFQLRLLSITPFRRDLQAQYQGLTIDIDERSREIVFHGQHQDVLAAKSKMNEWLASVKSDRIRMSDAQMQLLENPATQRIVTGRMDASSVTAVWNAMSSSGELEVHALNDQQAAQAASILSSTVLERECPVPASEAAVLQSRDFQNHVLSLKDFHRGKLLISIQTGSGKVIITATDDIIRSVVQDIDSYLKGRKDLSETVSMSKSYLKFVKKFGTKEISAIEKKHGVSISVEKDGVKVYGSKEKIVSAKKQLQDFVRSIVYREQTLTDDFDIGFLNSYQCKDVLQSWITKNNKQCVISLDPDVDPSAQTTPATPIAARTVPVSPAGIGVASHPAHAHTGISSPSSINVRIVRGEIATEKVDMLVNSAPRNLKLNSGAISSSISKAAGQGLQDEVTAKYPNGMKAENVFFTKGHNLSCKQVCHMVLHDWGPGVKQSLGDMVITCLTEASRQGFASVSFPAVGIGKLGYPSKVVAEAILSAVSTFHRRASSTTLRDVRIVVYHTDVATYQVFQQVQNQQRAGVAPQVNQPSTSPAVQPSTNIITIKKGEIAEERVDMLVNSAPCDLNLDTGAVSSSILRVAGKGLQDEVRAKHPHRVSQGYVGFTSGHNLACRQVCHMVLESWRPGVEKSLSQMITACLTDANRQGFSSVAFPTLGTGNLKYPARVVAETMLDAVSNFQRDMPTTSLRDVRIVVYHKDDQMFHDFQHVQKQRGGISPVPAERIQTQAAGTKMPQTAPLSTGSTNQPSINVDIMKGEIAVQKVDMIVNSAPQDQNLSQGAISSSIVRAAGQGLQDEWAGMHPNGVKSGTVAYTKGHNLNCNQVCHMVLSNWGQGAETSLFKMITQCLSEANRQGFTSVAIPTLGTGNLKYPPDAVAETVFQAVSKFQVEKPTTSLRDVRIVVYSQDDHIFQVFRRVQAHRKATQVTNAPLAASPAIAQHCGNGNKSPINISIMKGEIAQQHVDMLVNSAPHGRNLNQGGISSSIVKAAGQGLQNEWEAMHPKGAKVGTVSYTKGYNLNCKQVCHMALHDWGPGAKQDLDEMITRCLTDADRQGFTSVAFPTLGIGGRKYPDVVVAETVLGSINKFGQNVPTTSLKTVNIVVYHKDDQTFQVFCNTQSRWKGAHQVAPPIITTPQALGIPKQSTQDQSPVLSKGNGSGSAQKTTLYITARDQKTVNDVLKGFGDCVKNHLKTEVVQEKQISRMTPEETKQIQAICLKHKVDMRGLGGKWALRGFTSGVYKANMEIKDMFRTKERLQEAQRLVHLVQWSYLKVKGAETKEKEYSKAENYRIEAAYQNKTVQSFEIEIEKKLGKKRIVIDFTTMKQYPKGKPFDRSDVIRRDKIQENKHLRLPERWNTPHDRVQKIPIYSAKVEYRDVEKNFRATLGKRTVTIIKIERVQNGRMWRQYAAQKDEMDRQNSGQANERMLWHGTSEDSVDKIIQRGFNRSYCGKNATRFGQGVYFAVKTSYSTDQKYSRPAPGTGYRYIFQCKVLVGHSVKGTHDMRYLPERDDGSKLTYDTATDDPNNPTMFVTFSDYHAYPEYLITFQ